MTCIVSKFLLIFLSTNMKDCKNLKESFYLLLIIYVSVPEIRVSNRVATRNQGKVRESGKELK